MPCNDPQADDLGVVLSEFDKSPFERRYDRFDPRFKPGTPGAGAVPFFKQMAIRVPPSASGMRVDIGESAQVDFWSDRLVGVAVENQSNFASVREFHATGRIRTLWFNGNGTTTAQVLLYYSNPLTNTNLSRPKPELLAAKLIYSTIAIWNGASNFVAMTPISAPVTEQSFMRYLTLERLNVGDIRRIVLIDLEGGETIGQWLVKPSIESITLQLPLIPVPVTYSLYVYGSIETVAGSLSVDIYGVTGL